MKELMRCLTAIASAALVAACASTGGGAGGTATDPGTTSPGTSAGDQNAGGQNAIWPIKTREHVDLWLHGYALLQEDTTFVPFFRRGYSSEMTVLKNRANVLSQLDANRDR